MLSWSIYAAITTMNDVMICYGFMDDYQRRDSRYVVTANEKGK